MSFEVRDLMADVLPADRLFACSDVTKAQGDQQCVDPTKPPKRYPDAAQADSSFAALRDQLREAVSQQAAAQL